MGCLWLWVGGCSLLGEAISSFRMLACLLLKGFKHWDVKSLCKEGIVFESLDHDFVGCQAVCD